MPTLTERFADFWERLRQSPVQRPKRVEIPLDHTDKADAWVTPLRADQNYFEVLINELYLPYQRLWFTDYDPMVLAISEFSYAGKKTSMPFVVGPELIKKSDNQIPEGMVFSDTCVAGPHPYRGGSVALSIILYRVERTDHARTLLNLIEKTASVLTFVPPLGAYLNVANVVLDGVETLTSTGDSTHPLIGMRKDINPLAPGYFALIDAPENEVDHDWLWVRGNRLLRGASLDHAEPIRDSAYVLYSITSATRDDVSMLPFYQTWQQIVQEAHKSSKSDVWEYTKTNMSTLTGMIDNSPDLTEAHKTQLINEWTKKMKAIHDDAVRVSNLGPAAKEAPSDLDHIRAKALAVLRL